MRPQNDCYIPALRPSGGAHPIGVWAHTQEETTWPSANHAAPVSINNRRRQERSAKCYCRLGGGLPRAVRNVEAKRHSRRSVPSRLFPLSDMFVIPSAWDSRSGGGCNLPEIRSRMSLPNSRVLPCWCIAGLEREPGVLTRSLSRSEKTASARRDKLSHSFCRHNSSWPAPSS